MGTAGLIVPALKTFTKHTPATRVVATCMFELYLRPLFPPL